MINHSDYSCDKCAREFSRRCRHCLHTAEKPPTRFKPKKKTGCETPEYRRPTLPPNPNLGWQPTKSSGTKPPKPPTSGSNAQKTPAYNSPPMPPVKPAKKEEITFNRVQLYCTIDDLNAYIHRALGDKHENDVYVPIGATINSQNLNVEIDFMSINPEEDDYGRRIRLEVKL